MSYVYPHAEDLVGLPLVDDGAGGYHGECVSLVKRYTHAPQTKVWREGPLVRGNTKLKKGTAIATFFSQKKYPQNGTGHAAFYIGQDNSGIWVVDQWVGLQRIQKRKISFRGKKGKDGVNDGDSYSVIEHD